jgi:hypothetical protein
MTQSLPIPFPLQENLCTVSRPKRPGNANPFPFPEIGMHTPGPKLLNTGNPFPEISGIAPGPGRLDGGKYRAVPLLRLLRHGRVAR